MEQRKQPISVIVPVYNVEAYLRDCLNSLLAQTYPNTEILLVNDASTDHSGGICDSYAARYAQVRAFHFSKNRGPSAARNEGIRRAQGAFISFVDADDCVEPKLLEKLYRSLCENKAEISACAADGVDVKSGPAAVYSRAGAVRCLAQGAPFSHVPWAKLYKAALLKQCPFDETIYYSEDLLFLYTVLKRVERVAYLPDILYHYNQREGSQVQSGMNERKSTALLAHDFVCKDAAKNFAAAVEDFRQLTLEADRSMAMLAVKNGCEGGRTFLYLKRLQANIRRHFSWRALALCPRIKEAISILILYVSAAAFWGIAAIFTHVKRGRGEDDGANKTQNQRGRTCI